MTKDDIKKAINTLDELEFKDLDADGIEACEIACEALSNELERQTSKIPDWVIRAGKTFVQAFLGVLIPEIVAILNNGFPSDWKTFWVLLAPTVAAALAAAISAVWNYILEHKE